MLRSYRNSLQIFIRSLSLSTRSCSAKKKVNESSDIPIIGDEEIRSAPFLPPNFFVRNIGLGFTKWDRILQKHPELKTLKEKDVINTMEALKSYNFSPQDVATKPMILYCNAITIQNRVHVLKECGFQAVTISILAKYVTVMNKTVAYLKSYGYIPYQVDVINCLKECFNDIEVSLPEQFEFSEENSLRELRQFILSCYLRQRLGMTSKDIEKLWKTYGRVRHKSFKSVQEIIQMLLNELNFPKERIINNAYVLHGDVENVRRILTEIPTIGGQDIREIAYARPKVLMSSCDSLLKTLQHVKDFGIPETALLRCLEVLTLGPDTVLERLRDLNENEEFQVFGTNPRVMRLVHYQNKARLRLEYLNQLKVRCASLHILSCGSEAFAKFAREGTDRTQGRDIVVFLANIMNKNVHDLRSMLSRHPYWCHIPVIHVKQCLDFLQSEKFTIDDIFSNIHLLLYPIKRIEEKLLQIRETDLLQEMGLGIKSDALSSNEVLTLLLYLIESEYHFTGDGIWTEHHTQQVENFHNLLPDFPESLNKVYKYGIKPSASSSTEEAVVHSQST